MEWSNEKNLVALCLNYACCDDILQPYVHKGHDMKLPLSFRATFRMKEFYDYKTEMYHGAFLWGASAQEAPTKDIQHDYRRGFIKFLSHESDLPGHVYNAVEVAADHGIHHILDDVARLITPKNYADYMLARAFASPTLERAKYVFNDLIKSAFDPDLLPRELETAAAAARFGERQFAKVMNAQRGVNIDFSLAAKKSLTKK